MKARLDKKDEQLKVAKHYLLEARTSILKANKIAENLHEETQNELNKKVILLITEIEMMEKAFEWELDESFNIS
tara:strand:- start:2251 stop:2472 length:222 start_codon:yes stop_codon:yes gene_type:complete